MLSEKRFSYRRDLTHETALNCFRKSFSAPDRTESMSGEQNKPPDEDIGKNRESSTATDHGEEDCNGNFKDSGVCCHGIYAGLLYLCADRYFQDHDPHSGASAGWAECRRFP